MLKSTQSNSPSLFEQEGVPTEDQIPIGMQEMFGNKVWRAYLIVLALEPVAWPDVVYVLGMQRAVQRKNAAVRAGLVQKTGNSVWCSRKSKMGASYRCCRPLPAEEPPPSRYEDAISIIRKAKSELTATYTLSPFAPAITPK